MRYSDLNPVDRAALNAFKGPSRKGRPGTDDCSFCEHSMSEHTANGVWHACRATECGDPTENRGRCAVYSSQANADRNEQWDANYEKPVVTTPQEVANRLHARRYGKGQDHFLIHSCGCAHEAMFYLGVEERLGMYWPDSNGGNAWDPLGQESGEGDHVR